MNCRRRPAGCWASWTKWSRPAASGKGIDRADYRFSRRDIREYTGWGTRNSRST